MEKRITLVTSVSLTSEPRVYTPPVAPHWERQLPLRRRPASVFGPESLFSNFKSQVCDMAARGARSRKVVEKNINKEEIKRHNDRFASRAGPTPNPDRVTSPVAGWRRNNSVANSGASVHSSESRSSGKLSSTGAKLATKIAAIAPKEEDQFLTQGKQTSAPRGRGGGVPIKAVEARNDRAATRSVKSGSSLNSSHGIRPASRTALHSFPGDSTPRSRSWEKTKLWTGGGTPPQPYKGFEHDDDLWMSDGNCLIFFAEETNQDEPRAMCRIHSQTLEQARSIFMINLLRYGEIVVDEDEHDFNPPSNRSGPSTPAFQSTWPLNEKSLGNLDELLNDDSTLGPIITSRSPARSTGGDTWESGQTITASDWQTRQSPPLFQEGRRGFGGEVPETPTPVPRIPQITHEIWFRAPSHITKPDIQRRHHMATRNYLALLYGLPLIGNDFYEMLSDLQNVMNTYYELNEQTERWDSAQVIIQYLGQRQLDDVRGNISAALGLMAWSEQAPVRWEAGYLEGFIHAVGMMTPRTSELREFRVLSQVSKHKLQNAYNAHQLRVIEAEERLANFDFPELWYAEGVATGHPAHRAFDAFREFLCTFYTTVWGDWPPNETDHQDRWLSRMVVNRLQADLGALYDYIVDRDIKWDVSEERHTRKWEMVPQSAHRGGSFRPDFPGLPVTNMLVGFDSSLRFDHIPHPFPLLPVSSAPVKEKPAKKGFLSKFNKKEAGLAGPKEQFQMALAFNAATNVDRLGTAFQDNKLLDTFQHHEKSFLPSTLPPADARLGRWILLYALLQVLSTLSVDVLGLKHATSIRYFASPPLEGLPPWRTPNYHQQQQQQQSQQQQPSPNYQTPPLMREARQALSYCWLAPGRWARDGGSSGDMTPTPPAYEMQAPARLELDGRGAQQQQQHGSVHSNMHAFASKSASLSSGNVFSQAALAYGAGSPLLAPRLTGPPHLLPDGVVGAPEVPSRNPQREKEVEVGRFGLPVSRSGFV